MQERRSRKAEKIGPGKVVEYGSSCEENPKSTIKNKMFFLPEKTLANNNSIKAPNTLDVKIINNNLLINSILSRYAGVNITAWFNL
jgi:hypothetical protein